jgi:hypothetical protein
MLSRQHLSNHETSMVDQSLSTHRRRLSPAEWGILAFNVLYLATALIASFVLNNREFLLYVTVTSVLLALGMWAHFNIHFHILALMGLSLWGVAHMAGGLMPVPGTWPIGGATPVLYNLWLVPGLLKFDQLVHAYGFGLVTWICWQGLQRGFANRGVVVTPTFGLLTLCVAGGMGFGAMNEVVEFVATLTLPKTNVGGYENTGWDLVSNLVGGLTAAVLIRLGSRSGK